ncbi:MAG: hypothetical protein Q9195_004029 [Heterodermia aff. obscurata]
MRCSAQVARSPYVSRNLCTARLDRIFKRGRHCGLNFSLPASTTPRAAVTEAAIKAIDELAADIAERDWVSMRCQALDPQTVEHSSADRRRCLGALLRSKFNAISVGRTIEREDTTLTGCNDVDEDDHFPEVNVDGLSRLSGQVTDGYGGPDKMTDDDDDDTNMDRSLNNSE